MQENEQAPVFGKVSNLEQESNFVQGLRRFKVKPIKVAQAHNSVFSEWQYNYEHRDWRLEQYRRVSVQERQDGQINWEKFYYAN